MTQTASTVSPPADEIVARPARGYRVKWGIMGLVLIAYGWWSLYDGYVNYDRVNQQAVADATAQGKPPPDKLPHSELDKLLNQLIGIALQPLGLFVLGWAFYNSRGTYRFDGATLTVPGHPPVPLDSIREIDKGKWERKGIAYLAYEVPGGGQVDRLKLDDYVYEREPTDQILDRIEAAVVPGEPDVATSAPENATK